MSGKLHFVEIMGPGGALLDFDRDGDLDLFAAQGHPLPGVPGIDSLGFDSQGADPEAWPTDRLYRNRSGEAASATGSQAPLFEDVTHSAGLSGSHGYGIGAAVGDIDNDGWPDLYVTNFGANQLWCNRGQEVAENENTAAFEDCTELAGVGDPGFSVGATFVDVDGDGWLDLYVANYVHFDLERHRPCRSSLDLEDYCSPLSYTPASDTLYRNLGPDANGQIRFEDISEESGIARTRQNGLGVLTGDFDSDGRFDIYVANDMTPNLLWKDHRPNGDRRVSFEDEALYSGLAINGRGKAEASMGIAAGDIDGNGLEDLLLTHLRSETHTLYLQGDSLEFEDRTRAAGLASSTMPATGFGTAFVDIDNDGDLDLAVANGAVTAIESLARQGDPHPLHQADQLFRNSMQVNDNDAGGMPLEPPTFVDISAEGGEHFQRSEIGRGLVAGDIDNDGDDDLVIFSNNGPARLLLSRANNLGGWVGARVLDQRYGRPGLGARVTATLANGRELVRWVRRDGSYASARDPRVLFGLGEDGQVTRLQARWPDGFDITLEAPEAGTYHDLIRPTEETP